MSMAPQPPVRVMVVEDSLVVRQLLVHIIASDPRLVVAAAVSSAEEALQEIGRVQPDVISMDIRLPGIDGLEATRRIMSEQPTPIVVIADSIEDSSLKISMNALRAGALTVVEKPVGLSSANYAGIAGDDVDQQLTDDEGILDDHHTDPRLRRHTHRTKLTTPVRSSPRARADRTSAW